MILAQLSLFWSNTEIVLELLTKKGQHFEQFIDYTTNPKLVSRFKYRIKEYKRFWESVIIMCTNYITGVEMNTNLEEQQVKAYDIFFDIGNKDSTKKTSPTL